MTTPFIEFQNISFAYGERPIISDINFTIHHGESVAIMGGSGCGKTTLLRLITRQLQPKSGIILINGKDLATFSANELYEYRRAMGVLFQFGALFTDLSVYDNVAFPLREHTRLPESIKSVLRARRLPGSYIMGLPRLDFVKSRNDTFVSGKTANECLSARNDRLFFRQPEIAITPTPHRYLGA